MPFWPGTGIPYGISSLAFAAGAAEAGSTVGASFSSLRGFDGSPDGVGLAWGTRDSREVGRREVGVFFWVSRGVG
jgi:hypothetical protein